MNNPLFTKTKVICTIGPASESYEKIKALAEKEQRSLNNLIEYAMQKYVDEYELNNGPILPEP